MAMMQNTEIAWRVMRWRREAGLTQAQLATRAGITRNTVHRLERAMNMPETRTLDAIARALDKPLSALIAPSSEVA